MIRRERRRSLMCALFLVGATVIVEVDVKIEHYHDIRKILIWKEKNHKKGRGSRKILLAQSCDSMSWHQLSCLSYPFSFYKHTNKTPRSNRQTTYNLFKKMLWCCSHKGTFMGRAYAQQFVKSSPLSALTNSKSPKLEGREERTKRLVDSPLLWMVIGSGPHKRKGPPKHNKALEIPNFLSPQECTKKLAISQGLGVDHMYS